MSNTFLQGERAGRMAFVVLVHVTLLWCVFKVERIESARRAGAGEPAMVWIHEAVTALAPHDTPSAAPPSQLRVPAPVVVPAPAPVYAETPQAAPERVVMAQAEPGALPVASSSSAAPDTRNPAEGAPDKGAAPSAQAAPAPAAAPGASRGDEAAKAINVEILTSTSALYTIPLLTGEQKHEVNRGLHATIEAAIVHDFVERIRATYPDYITWNALRGGSVRLSMHIEDNSKVEDFLLMDIFGIKRLSYRAR